MRLSSTAPAAPHDPTPRVACPQRPVRYIHPMRTVFALFFLATPAAAWEFSASPICTLTDSSAKGEITVTYDAAIPEYTITVTLPEGRWQTGPVFGMTFANDRPISIQTDRQTISPDGRSVTVKDRGFSNVLDGLEFNTRAYAMLGDTTVGFDLSGIGPAMTAFRACPAAGLS